MTSVRESSGYSSALFTLQPAITSWLPDETLFSLGARYHHIAANRRSDHTCRALFGHPRQGSSHDLPARVDEFVHRTRGVLGNADRIIHERTLLPFYLRLRSQTDARNAVAAVRSGGLGPLKARLGVLASRFGAAPTLKSCSECMAEDRKRVGVAYWHRNHQWQGACICAVHERTLDIRLGKVNLAGRFQWLLPDDLQGASIVAPREASPDGRLMARLTGCCQGFGNLAPNFHFDLEAMRATYVHRLAHLHLATESGSIHAEACAGFLADQIRPLGALRGFETLAARGASMGHDFIRLFRTPRSAPHPLRHLLLITALFASWEEFSRSYELELAKTPVDHAIQDVAPSAEKGLRQNHLKVVGVVQGLASGGSARAAALSAGVSVATAMAWAASAGKQVRRRPKKLTPELWTKAVALLRRGSAKVSVASSVGVSIETITRVLRTTPGLQEAWHHVRRERQRRGYRAAWERTARRLPTPSASTLRAMQPAAFAWLYRNDRAWLEEFAKTLANLPRSNNSRVRWDARDSELANQIQSAAIRLQESSGSLRLQLSQLCDEVPTLKGRLSRLDQLPLTRSALKIATGRR